MNAESMPAVGGRGGRIPPPNELEIVRMSAIEDAREHWMALAEPTGNIFSTWEWADVWWRHFGEGKRLNVAAIRRGREMIGILPVLVQRRAGVRVLRFIGHGVGDQLGPVCHPSDVPAAVAGIAEIRRDGELLLAERLPPDRDWAGALRGRVVREDASPVIDLDTEGDWDSYLAAHSANFRQQVRRRARRLQRALGVKFRLASDPRRLEADFNSLVALHTARWGEQSTAFTGACGTFHREFAACALERGWLRLWLAEAEGTPVAAWYGFRFAGIESFYQGGRDPAWDRFGLGVGILEHSIREAFADGMREYRMLRGDEAYKSSYATRRGGICTVAAPGKLVGYAALAVLSLLAKSRAGRSLLRGLDA